MSGGRPLALDIATTTGWAFWFPGDDKPTSGSVTFDGGVGEFIFSFESWLREVWFSSAISVSSLVIEQPIVMRGRTTFQTTCRLVGSYATALKVAFDFDVPVDSIPPSQWRKVFIGCAAAPKTIKSAYRRRQWLKETTIQECQNRGWKAANDNCADALGLLSYASSTGKKEGP